MNSKKDGLVCIDGSALVKTENGFVEAKDLKHGQEIMADDGSYHKVVTPLSEAEKTFKIKKLVSQHIPDGGIGSFFRELIFTHAILDWNDVALLLKRHFPELTKDVDEIIK